MLCVALASSQLLCAARKRRKKTPTLPMEEAMANP